MDDTQVNLLQQVLGREAAGSPPDIGALLAEQTDPTVRMLMDLWAKRREADAEEEINQANKASEKASELATSDRSAQRKLAFLEREVERLFEINDSLAVALGACYLCWGEDTNCEACGGEGRPGAEQPDRELFRRLVLPAVKKMKATLTSAAPRFRSQARLELATADQPKGEANERSGVR